MVTRSGLPHPRAPRAWPAAVCALLAACAAASPAPRLAAPSPQALATPAPAGPPCGEAIPESLLTVTDTVWVHAFLVDTTARGMLPEADLLAQRVAYRLRRLLGGWLDSLPRGEPRLTWRNRLGGNVEVKARRDGQATWQELMPMPLPDPAPTKLVADALDSLRADHEMVTWAAEAPRESVEIRLALAHTGEPSFERAIGVGFPAFTLRRPAESDPILLSHPPIHYPETQRSWGVEGHVVLRVTIDSLGMVVPTSIENVWPDPRPTGQALANYLAFSDAAHEVLIGSRYLAARLGGCPVAKTMVQPFNFWVSRDPGR